MTIRTACPACGTSYQFADKLEGKTVRCRECQKMFPVRPREDDEAPEAKAGRITADKPRPLKTPSPEQDEDDEDRPRPRLRRGGDEGARERPRDEDDEDDDRPPRRSSRKEGAPRSKRRTGLLIGLAAGGVVLAAAVVVAVWLLSRGASKDGDGGDNALSPNVLASCATDIAVNSEGWVFNERTLVSPKAAVICYRRLNEDNKHHCAVYGLPDGKPAGDFALANVTVPQSMALSPDGSHLAVEEMVKTPANEFDRVITVWSLPAGRALFTRWQPYPSVPTAQLERAREYRLAWMTFVDGNRLLTLTEGGRVTLWTVPEHKPLYDERPIVPQPNKEFRKDIYSWEPSSFALSPDRRTLALRQGEGALLVETATGKTTGTLPPPGGLGNLPGFHGMAFSPDGNRLAAAMRSINGRQHENLMVVWDIPKRAVSGSHRFVTSWGGTAWTWWGNRHVLGLEGSVGKMLLLSADTGKPLRQCFGPLAGRFANGSLDGKVWFVSAVSKTHAHLLAYGPPDDFLAKDAGADDGQGNCKQIWFSPKGVERQGADQRGNIKISLRE